MPISLDTCPNPIPDGTKFSVFLDVDGVLLEITEKPEQVSLPPDLLPILNRLVTACNGAVALVSGRSLAFLEHMFATLPVAMAGLHGVERRMPDGEIQVLETSETQLSALRASLNAFVAEFPAIGLEDKGMAIALHFRSNPELGNTVLAFLERVLPELAPNYHIQPGKMVYEVKPHGMDKGSAIELLLARAPFTGRLPVFAGDDVTDEHGFAVVNQHDGVSIKVGDGPETIARYHIGSVSELRGWLSRLADGLGTAQ